MKKSIVTITALIASIYVSSILPVQAEDKPNAVGRWTWTSAGRNGGPEMKHDLTLKSEDGKLTGKLETKVSDDQKLETKVEDAKLEGDKLTFNVNPEFNGN